MAVAEGAARDNTEDWLLPEAAKPRSFDELEARIDLALTVARSSESAAVEVGAAAIEAAEQARQAAALAERAAIAAEAAAAPLPAPEPEPAGAAVPTSSPAPPVPPEPVSSGASPAEDWLIGFTHRAERLSARLDRLRHC
ncbi:MAG TPA: hypothetical protein VGG40_10095 [Solirubrobacterales bacterium]|jgi:hypothetical protein